MGVRVLGELLAAGLAAAVLLGLTLPLRGVSASAHNRIHDTNNLRQISMCLLSQRRPRRAPDGRLDVYRGLAEDGLDSESIAEFCSSTRLDRSVTKEQVESGDYSHFPWLRASIQPKQCRWCADHTFPLLWEAKPDKNGKRLIAHSTGAVKLR